MKVKKFIAAILSGAVALTMCAGTTLSVSAAGVYQEEESEHAPGSIPSLCNDSYENAEVLPVSSLLDGTYTHLIGNFASTDGYTDNADYYKFSTKKTTGNSGRIAITLDGIPTGHDYDLYLFDSNRKLIDSSENAGTTKEVVKTPAVTVTTSYYLVVKPKTIPDHSLSSYKITVSEYIKTATTTVSLSPRELSAKSNQWSSDAYGKITTSIPKDAVIVTAKISAERGKVNNSANNVLRVKKGKSGNYISVTWATGDIEIKELAGKPLSAEWYAGFKATEIPLGVNTSLGFTSMYNFKVTITYEYPAL
ncbi:MAG: hypothetical protein NC078_09935 [Ruminococcus sp.]|nr:hypothetical protein [Ruminococcus sp.]